MPINVKPVEELSSFTVARSEKALELTKIQKHQAIKMAADMHCSPTSENYNLILVGLMQVLAANHAAFHVK